MTYDELFLVTLVPASLLTSLGRILLYVTSLSHVGGCEINIILPHQLRGEYMHGIVTCR